MLALFLITVLGLIYYLAKKQNDYWKNRNIPGPSPVLLFGNIWANFIGKKSMSDITTDIYNAYKDYPIVGFFNTTNPTLLIRDPEFIKDITVKSFKNFHDNFNYADLEIDPVLGRNPFFLKGEAWKRARQQLTPFFTSGIMKTIFPLIENVCKRMVRFIEDSNGKSLESKELCTRFTVDSMASCAFGFDGKSFDEETSTFRGIADNFLAPGTFQSVMILLTFLIPQSLSKFLKIKLLKKVSEDELRTLIKDTLEYREKNGIVRNDFLHSMNKIRLSYPDEFTYEDITAHVASFFGDGFETSSVVMSFILYELACNQKSQDALRAEIRHTLERNDNQITYESLQQMKYLDACYNESLRKNTPVGVLFKECTNDYNYTTEPSSPYKKLTLNIEKGTSIALPIHSLHNDPQYFPEPEKFQPERFLGENKKSLTKYTFLPFGKGPRACLGLRFGGLQIKLALAHIIQNFYVTPNKKTKTPLKFNNWYLLLSPIGGLWLDFKKA